MPIARSILY